MAEGSRGEENIGVKRLGVWHGGSASASRVMRSAKIGVSAAKAIPAWRRSAARAAGENNYFRREKLAGESRPCRR